MSVRNITTLAVWLVAIGMSAQTLKVRVTNPSDTDRKDVPVVVDLHKTLGKKAAKVNSAVVIDAKAVEIPRSSMTSTTTLCQTNWLS